LNLELKFRQRLTDSNVDGLWLRERLMVRFADGNAARPTTPPPGAPPPRPGAVLVLLYPHAGTLYVPLTVRTAALRNHSGEVSLPGGRFDEHDGDLQTTALREAWEELAIPAQSVQIWTTLTPVWIPVSNFQITPFVGWTERRPYFAPAPDEVAELIEVPLDTLMQPAIIRSEIWERRGVPMHVPFFALGTHKVWGATALVLAELVGKLGTSARAEA
jgi:8-oxo-dGTP pyrophosphatase MutT (NUDIX family)